MTGILAAVRLAPAGLLVAFVAVAVMGFAIQRGATCTVAAVAEIVEQRRARRLLALLESALWVNGGIIVARASGFSMAAPIDHPLTLAVVTGGALLGLGAFVAGVCVFGAVARLGSGEWAFAAVPLGYYLGCLVAAWLGVLDPAPPLATVAPVVAAPAWLALPVLGLAALRLAWIARRGGWYEQTEAGTLWHPHSATIVIALAFVFLLFLAGPWAYTDAIAGFARGMVASLGPRSLLLAALFGGAMAGAWASGRWASRRPDPVVLLRCLAGGGLMALGGLLIPGGNDGLILVGLPNLQPYAWVAMAAMVATVAAALVVQKRLRR
ncbi:MAG: YeeE/YedE family protein [Sandarakinorhabdus sp.]|nr:YeeE/YedE family protein [Sandarakinorhabdus sp.]